MINKGICIGSGMINRAAGLIGILTIIISAGCANPTQIIAPSAIIENRTGRNLSAINYRPCGIESTEWRPLTDKILPSYNHVNIDLPLDCVDLKAYFSDGKLAGTQQNIQRRFPFNWVLR